MFDLTMQQVLFRAVTMLLVGAIHGFVLAGIARLLGDKGPEQDGRLTPGPLAHVDPIGLAFGTLFQIGWIRPVDINPKHTRPGRLGLLICVLGSAIVVLAVAWGVQFLRFPALLAIRDAAALNWVYVLIDTTAQMAIWFALANLVPIPPLTGARLWSAIVPGMQAVLPRLYFYGVGVLLVLATTGLASRFLRPAFDAFAAILTIR
jgi:Zn-dependent protease